MADEIKETPVEQLSEVQPEVVVEKLEESPKVEEAKPVEQPAEEPKEELVEEAKAEELKAEEPKVEDKEQLYRDVNPKKQIELAKASEAKEEEVKPAEVAVEPAKEDKKSKKADKEKLSEDIQKTEEELSVIKEVREELVSLYAANKTLESDKESLSKENEALKASVEQLTSQLQTYKAAEEKLTAEKRATRLEQLSAKFKELGQEKTVEYLSGKDEETLSEFEKIVDAAIEKLGDNKEATPVTESTQAEKLSEDNKKHEEKLSNEVAKVAPKKESLSNEKFFANICNTLSKEQTFSKGNHRATYL